MNLILALQLQVVSNFMEPRQFLKKILDNSKLARSFPILFDSGVRHQRCLAWGVGSWRHPIVSVLDCGALRESVGNKHCGHKAPNSQTILPK